MPSTFENKNSNMKNKFLLLFFSLFFIISSSYAEVLEKIEITGLNVIDRGTVLSYLPIEVGDNLTDKTIETVRESLIKTGFFSQVKTDLILRSLNISLNENPTVKYLDIENFKDNEVLSDEIILNLKKNHDLITGKIFQKKNLENLLMQIKSLYELNGFYSSQLSFKIDIDSNNRAGIVIDIEEGNQALIESLKFSGNDFFESDFLADLIDVGEPDFFLLNYFTEKDSFNKKIFDSGIENIKNEYLKSGFLNIEFEDIKMSLDKNNEKLSIFIKISEGPQFRLNNISIVGQDIKFSENEINNFFEVSKGDPIDQKLIIEGIKKLSNSYANKGFAFAAIDSSLASSEKSDEVNVNINVSLNNKVYINRIIFSGNTKTQDNVLRREMKILEGQLYSKKDIDDSIIRLKRLNYFDNVSLSIQRSSVDSDKVNLLIKVSEKKTGEMSIGLAHSSSTGAAVNAGVRQRNFFGTGNTLDLKFTNSEAVEEISLYFLDPHYNIEGHQFSYGVFSKKLDASNLDVSSYQIDEIGAQFGYGIPIDSDSDIFGELRFSSLDVFCGSTFASSGYELEQCSKNYSHETTSSLNYSSNTLNDNLFPTKGTRKNLKALISIPGLSDFNYFELKSGTQTYFDLSDNLTLKTGLDLNYSQGYAGDDLPFFKRHYSGGSSSIKGFDFNSLGSKYPDGNPKGGELSFLANTTLISPMKYDGMDKMRVGAFVDMGGLSEKISSFEVDDIRISSGVSFVWATPIGPLSIYFAKPLKKKTDDATKSFSFELGSNF